MSVAMCGETKYVIDPMGKDVRYVQEKNSLLIGLVLRYNNNLHKKDSFLEWYRFRSIA